MARLPATRRDIFDQERLPPALDSFLRQTNPWWENRPGPPQPTFRRWAFDLVLRKLESGLAPVVALRGPRQVGKTTLQQQLIAHLIAEKGVRPNEILRVQFDEIPSLRGLADPMLALSRWFENRILGQSFNEAARAGRPAYLLFDEVQNLDRWAEQTKALVDHNAIKVVVTGSSALRIEAGRDSLAGRVTQVELGTLLLREIAGLRFGDNIAPALPENGLEALLRQEFWRALRDEGLRRSEARDRAFREFSRRGGYPVAQVRHDVPWAELADQLNETVIQRAIQHDLRVGEKGRKRDQRLLEEVFRLACRYAGQSPGPALYVGELRSVLRANVGWQRILAYLNFLDSALLLKLARPLELRLKKRKGNLKLCLCDHALRASWLQEVVPIDPDDLEAAPHLYDLAGHIAESVTGYFLGSLPHLDLAHFPERAVEPEVDFILTIGDRRIPVEVKYRRRIDPLRDTTGLRAFLEKTVYNAPFGLLVTMLDDAGVADPRIVTLPLRSLLLLR